MSKHREELLNVNVMSASDDDLIMTANRLFIILENGGSIVYLIYLIVLSVAVAAGCMLALLNTILGFLLIMILVVLGVCSSMKLFEREENRMKPINRKFDEVKKELNRRGYSVSVERMPYGCTYVMHCTNILDIRKK